MWNAFLCHKDVDIRTMRPSVNPFDINNFTVVPEVAASPAAAANYIGAVPVNARSTLALMSFQLVTDANAADRVCEIQLHRGADVYILSTSLIAQVASKTFKYLGYHGQNPTFATYVDTYPLALPDIPLFLEDDTVRIIAHSIQAADQLSAIRLTWKVWPYEQ